MVAELDTEAETGNKINDKDSIHFDRVGAEDLVKHPHSTDQLE
jgi:hypothetical protein